MPLTSLNLNILFSKFYSWNFSIFKGFGLFEKRNATKSAMDMKKRITHFGPMDVRAVESVRAKGKQHLCPAKLRARERQREMELRRMLEGDEEEHFDHFGNSGPSH